MEIFVFDLSKPVGEIGSYYAMLSFAEKSMADRKSLPRVRSLSILSKAAARIILSEKLGQPPEKIRIVYGENGKPYVAGNPLFYSVSHSNSLMAIAVGGYEMGIDLEYMKNRDFEGLARHAFSDEVAAAILKSRDMKNEFYRQWTLFEAALKMKGLTIFHKECVPSANCHFAELDDYMLAVVPAEDFISITRRSL